MRRVCPKAVAPPARLGTFKRFAAFAAAAARATILI